MPAQTAERVLDLASRRGVLRPRDLVVAGIPRIWIYRLHERGLLERVGRGLYRVAGADVTASHSLTEAARRIPKGVVCLLSSLQFHELTTQLPHEVWIAIDVKAWKPRTEDVPVRVVRFSGKALTAGTMGLAATVATDRVFDAFLSDDPTHALMHGPTFMANPLACAAANASLDLFESEPRLEQVRVIEGILEHALRPCAKTPGVIDVRCKGAVGVVQVERLHSVERLRARFVEQGVWLRPFGDMVYLTPSLSIDPEQLEELCDSVVSVITEWSRW